MKEVDWIGVYGAILLIFICVALLLTAVGVIK